MSTRLMSNAAYLRAELHQQFGSIGTVGGQAAHCCAEVGQTGDGFAGLGGPAGSFGVARAGCRTGGKAGAACCCQAHQSDESPDVSQSERLQTGCEAAAGTAVWEGGRERGEKSKNSFH